jgi:hypothetical protein
VPIFLAGRETDEAAGTDLLDRAFPALRPAATSSDDENLTKRMRMPSGAVRGSKVTLAPHTNAESGA